MLQPGQTMWTEKAWPGELIQGPCAASEWWVENIRGRGRPPLCFRLSLLVYSKNRITHTTDERRERERKQKDRGWRTERWNRSRWCNTQKEREKRTTSKDHLEMQGLVRALSNRNLLGGKGDRWFSDLNWFYWVKMILTDLIWFKSIWELFWKTISKT